MDQQTFRAMWDLMRQKYGVYLRVLDTLPEERFHDTCVQGMRTPAQMVVHTSGSIVKDMTQGVARGRITADEGSEDARAAELGGKEEVLDFARECWRAADEAAGRIGDEELQAMVPTPWDMTFPGSVMFGIMNDEFLHHRGQLYAYARACGVEPPFIWSHDQNPEGFRPEA